MVERRTTGFFIAGATVLGALALAIVPLLQTALTGQSSLIGFDHNVIGILWFTVKQASLSTLLSVAPGIAVAHAFHANDFPGRKLLLQCFSLPLAMPAIVIVLALTALFGASGLFPDLFALYGLQGILLAHVFFNMPMVTRYLLVALQTVSLESYKLSSQLGLGPWATFMWVEWHTLKTVLPQACALVFLLCAASFIIVLTLGGPSATTLEVAIFQSIRADFDLARALQLSGLQVILCLACVTLAWRMFHSGAEISALRVGRIKGPKSNLSIIVATASIVLATVLVLPALAVVILGGIPHIHFSNAVAQAILFSVMLGLCSAAVAVMLSWPLASNPSGYGHVISLAAYLIPPAVLATGWFIATHNFADSVVWTYGFVITLNALMALPFAAAALASGFARTKPLTSRLSNQLGMSAWNTLWLVELPLLRRQAAQAFLLAFNVSLGDLTAITLFDSHGLLTLPSLLRVEMGHFRSQEAMGTALFLLVLCAATTWLAQKIGDKNA